LKIVDNKKDKTEIKKRINKKWIQD
jgi:hypothetical protein